MNCHGAIVASPLLRVRLGPEEVTPSVGRVPGSICARKSPGMQATDRPRSADGKERCGDELLDRYRRREYARRYKAEYTAGLTPQHLRSRIIAGGEKALIARLLREIDPAGSVLLDVPCGAGKLGRLLQSVPVHVVAADVSREMLGIARAEYDPAQLLRFLQCDAGALPLKDGSVDMIICLRLFHLLAPERRRMILDEFRRVARGQLLVSYSYGSRLQQIRRTVRTLYARQIGGRFHVLVGDVMREIEAAGFTLRTWKYVLPVLSSEIIVHASI